jgi:predicted transcriptional regulator
MDKTTLYMPDDLHRGLQTAAKQSGRSQAELVREAVREYLSRMARPTLTSIGSGEDPGLAGKDTEDWLDKEWAVG